MGKKKITAVGFRYNESENNINATPKKDILLINPYCLAKIVLKIKMPKEINTGSINKYLEKPKPRGDKPRIATTDTENNIFRVMARL